jgi:hypothetical protein
MEHMSKHGSVMEIDMKVSLVIASVNTLENVKAFEPTLARHDCKVIVIDEGENTIRKINEKLLSNIAHEYYGPRERREWFKKRFGNAYKNLLLVVPRKCHAETSFGFLVAYEEKPDIIVEIDDDVFPYEEYTLIDTHVQNLQSDNGITVICEKKWYNTIENLKLNKNLTLFPRGHPYEESTRNIDYKWKNNGGKCILNMGLWAGHPDLDAVSILHHGGLNGQCNVKALGCKREKIIVEKGGFFAVCSMNTSFLPEIVPAFYQLYNNWMGIDRFDDIWSGIFLKKILDHLGKKICLGAPLVYHRKRPRDIFKDLAKELKGMIINEKLWRLVDEAEIKGSTYWEAYSSLAHELEKKIYRTFTEPSHRKFLRLQIKKMKLWLKITDYLT